MHRDAPNATANWLRSALRVLYDVEMLAKRLLRVPIMIKQGSFKISQCASYSLTCKRCNIVSEPPNVTGMNNLSQSDPKTTGSKGIQIFLSEGQRKSLEEIFGEVKDVKMIVFEGDPSKEVIEVNGIPEEHQEARRARVFMPAKATPQSGWNNTGFWKIELDNQERWDNPNIGWCSNADPLSNIAMALSFATRDDAVFFCKKNRWTYEVDEPQERKIIPKSYGSNFHWKNRTRVSTK